MDQRISWARPDEDDMTRIVLAIAVCILGLCAGPASAQDKYPNRPIKIIVPTPAGGPVDVAARVVANYLASALGQSVIVDNRPGAGNTIGSKEAARAEPDGYTLLYSAVSGLILAPMLQKDAGYDPITSFAPVAVVTGGSLILVVHPSVPAKSVQELVAYAKANPGKINFSSGGIGVLPHLTGEMFKAAAGINIVHVPYRGGAPSIQDVVAGNVQMTFEGTGVLLPLIRDGKLRALATPSAKRIAEMPELPTMIEAGFPSVVSRSWTGLLAPVGTPREIISRLNSQINRGLKSPDLLGPLAKISAEPLGGSPEEFMELMKSDLARWGPVVKSLNLKTN
jgi:tripartite-type tricarboxylate transporter receptor subunit TctC